ncbi:hypothetical protein [Actinoallomurus iriomotensis]|uniref:Uncharacterized protein n=1 Tax=Actinoallomurus iriomotensis TaxID=478107 RepID=A0A9W6VUW0_9ACTN|nr:hypothetical protein [Actinoallomurus iriomotensis]GLY80574.1 hypothetical protein Airi01_088410 [Actinoallomurus iriomotensis]
MTGCEQWARGPFGFDLDQGATIRPERRVLVVAHHVTSGTRLADVMPLLESDRRIQVAYTAAPRSIFDGGLGEYLRGLGGLVLPWHQATRTSFDLAVAAADGMLEHLHAPVMTLQHGAGPSKLLIRAVGSGPHASRPVAGMMRERLIVGGRVVPSAIVLAHTRHLQVLERECPEALPVAIVGGDPCLDRLVASKGLREAYRRALGVHPGQKLVFITSTCREQSLLGEHLGLLSRAPAELPREYRVAAALHPNVWAFHGRRQVISWLDEALRHGLRLLPPEEGYRAALIAADWIIGDHGSATYYGAAIGVPTLLAAFPEDDVVPGSHVARLGAIAPRLDPEQPLLPQLEKTVHAYNKETYAALRNAISSRPGGSALILRREMYRLMRLPEPERPPRIEPLPPPRPIQRGIGWAA